MSKYYKRCDCIKAYKAFYKNKRKKMDYNVIVNLV